VPDGNVGSSPLTGESGELLTGALSNDLALDASSRGEVGAFAPSRILLGSTAGISSVVRRLAAICDISAFSKLPRASASSRPRYSTAIRDAVAPP
jgi:hypothetical protein